MPIPATPSPTARRLLALVTLGSILLGVHFRFARLDDKFFWIDESHSAGAVAGLSTTEIDALFDNTPRRLAELKTLLHPQPRRSVATTIAVVSELPENAPLHFATLKIWADLFGDSPTLLRAYSAVLSLVGGVLLWLLCRELNLSRTASMCAICWWSLSPIFVIYSQEARTYSLFAVLTLTAHILLLRAVRLPTLVNWIGYVLATAAGLYTHMFTGLMLASHGAFVAATGLAYPSAAERNRLFVRFAAATGSIVAAFVPWLVVIVAHKNPEFFTDHLAVGSDIPLLLQSWAEGMASLLVDFGLHGNPMARIVNLIISIFVVGLVLAAVRYTWRTAPRRTALFLLTTGGIPPLLLIGSDLAQGGMRSEIIRYWIPAMISMGLAVSYAVAAKVDAGSRRAAVLAAVLWIVAAISCARSSVAPMWWNKGGVVSRLDAYSFEYQDMTAQLPMIAATPDALIVTENSRFIGYELLSLSLRAAPNVEWLGVAEPDRFELPTDRTIFLYNAPRLLKRLTAQNRPMEGLGHTWMFRRIPPASADAQSAHSTVPH